MIVLVCFGLAFIVLVTYAIIRISISCIFWSFNQPADKRHVFKTCFPYYIITLVLIGLALIIEFDKEPVVIYYAFSVYLLALFIWRSELKSSKKNNKNFAVEPNQPQLP